MAPKARRDNIAPGGRDPPVMLRVRRAGFSTTVQDLGRTGFRDFGVSSGGALDAFGLRVANLLVGNGEASAGLEITFAGLRIGFADDRVIAWCGGAFAARLGSTSLSAGRAALARDGDELAFDQPEPGCRCWLAVSGGVDAPVVLGSRSTDLRANFGGWNGRTLRDGDELALGEIPGGAKVLTGKLRDHNIADWTAPHDWVSTARRDPVLRFTRGADWHRFNDVTIQRITNEPFTVSPDSDRMGIRFDTPELKRSDDVDLLSEAVAPGTVQVPPNGKPILLLGDCQTIGGYPKCAHVITVDLPVAAQLRAGDKVSFEEVSLAQAHQLLREREENLAQFRRGIEIHFA